MTISDESAELQAGIARLNRDISEVRRGIAEIKEHRLHAAAREAATEDFLLSTIKLHSPEETLQ